MAGEQICSLRLNCANEGEPNNGMHPTPRQHVFHVRCARARVMPGVSPLLLAEDKNEVFG